MSYVTISKEHFEKLVHYEDLEEQGRLIELPCKVGDTMYKVCNNANVCYECEHFEQGEYGMWDYCEKLVGDESEFPQLAETPVCEKQYYHIEECKAYEDILINNLKYFGKIYFITKEEAEAKLAELKGE